MKVFTTKRICRAAVIAALYAALTMALQPISYGNFQCRLSEAFTVLPLFFPEAIVGLTIGCLIANILGNGILDIIFGTLATLLAALTTYFIGRAIKKSPVRLILGEIPPILYNAIIVPFTFLAMTELKEAYFVNALWVGLGQLAAVGVLGTIFYFAVNKMREKNVSVFIDKEIESEKVNVLSQTMNIVVTLGILIPCVGAILTYLKQENAIFFITLPVGIAVILLALTIKFFSEKKQKEN